MKKGKLLITGGGGYIGTKLVDVALKTGRDVCVFDTFYFGKEKLSKFKGDPRLELVQGDIRAIQVNAFKEVEEVVNLAGISNDPSCDLNPQVTESTNFDGCVRVAKKAKEAGVKRFVDMSSCSVYGMNDEDVCTEETPLNPVSLYAKIKGRVEEAIMPLSSKDFVISSLRNSTTFGSSERMRFDLVVNIMTMNALLQGIIKISGDGSQSRPLIHVRDVAESCIQLLGADPRQVNGEIFNIVGVNLEISNVAFLIKRSLQRSLQREIRIEKFPQDYDIRTYKVDGGKIERRLGIKPKRTIEESVVEIEDGVKCGNIIDSPDCYTVQFYKNMKL